jgi:AcrR family transcriptional regulator
VSRRSGRRRGTTTTPDAIRYAARAQFAQRDYRAVTVRGIARDAGVDAALVHHFFGTKEGVFADAILDVLRPDALLPPILEPGLDGVGERLTRAFIQLWDRPPTRDPMLAVLRSAVSHPDAAAALRAVVNQHLLGPVASSVPHPDRTLRAALAGSQLLGLAMERYLLRLEPLASLDEDALVARVGPTIQRYLAG